MEVSNESLDKDKDRSLFEMLSLSEESRNQLEQRIPERGTFQTKTGSLPLEVRSHPVSKDGKNLRSFTIRDRSAEGAILRPDRGGSVEETKRRGPTPVPAGERDRGTSGAPLSPIPHHRSHGRKGSQGDFGAVNLF